MSKVFWYLTQGSMLYFEGTWRVRLYITKLGGVAVCNILEHLLKIWETLETM